MCYCRTGPFSNYPVILQFHELITNILRFYTGDYGVIKWVARCVFVTVINIVPNRLDRLPDKNIYFKIIMCRYGWTNGKHRRKYGVPTSTHQRRPWSTLPTTIRGWTNPVSNGSIHQFVIKTTQTFKHLHGPQRPSQLVNLPPDSVYREGSHPPT